MAELRTIAPPTEEDGLEALGINLPGLVAQIINFSLLLALLYMVLYRPVVGMLDRRAARIKESLEKAEEIKREAARMEQEFQARLEEARREGQAILAQAMQMSERIQQEARERAMREAEELLERARNEVALERDRAIAQLRRDFADLTIMAASRVINRSLNKEDHRRIIEQVLAEAQRN